jgi:hypothetical protein
MRDASGSRRPSFDTFHCRGNKYQPRELEVIRSFRTSRTHFWATKGHFQLDNERYIHATVQQVDFVPASTTPLPSVLEQPEPGSHTTPRLPHFWRIPTITL